MIHDSKDPKKKHVHFDRPKLWLDARLPTSIRNSWLGPPESSASWHSKVFLLFVWPPDAKTGGKNQMFQTRMARVTECKLRSSANSWIEQSPQRRQPGCFVNLSQGRLWARQRKAFLLSAKSSCSSRLGQCLLGLLLLCRQRCLNLMVVLLLLLLCRGQRCLCSFHEAGQSV